MANPHHLRWLNASAHEWNSRRSQRHFIPSLREADLTGLDLAGFNLRGAQLRGAKLAFANLEDATLVGAELFQADLTNANLTRARLNGAVLQKAILLGANMEDAELDHADFKGADLRQAVLRGASFLTSTFTRANVQGADIRTRLGFRPVNLKWVQGLTNRQLQQMDGDTAVILQEPLQHPSNWPFVEWKEDSDEPQTKSLGEASKTGDRYVFLSYAHDDTELASKLRETLEAVGIQTWWARRRQHN
jgi:Uncharacterized low-complexity proteins